MHISNVIETTLNGADLSFSDLWSVPSKVDVKSLLQYIKRHDLHNKSNVERFVNSRLRHMDESDAEALNDILSLGEYIIQEKTEYALSDIEVYDYQAHDHITKLLGERFGLSQGSITSLLFERVPLPETKFVMPKWCITAEVQYNQDEVYVPNGKGWESYNISISPFSNFADNYPETFGRWIDKLSRRDRTVNLPERIPV